VDLHYAFMKCKYPKYHEKKEGDYGEYEEDIKEQEKKNPVAPCVKPVSLWTIHGKPKKK